jgi:hypothetical protein
MGLYKGMVQNSIIGSYMLPGADDKKRSMYQKRRYEEKQIEKKLSIKKHSIPHFWTLGLKS